MRFGRRLQAYLLTPTGGLVVVAVLAPMLVMLYYSLFQWEFLTAFGHAGVANYTSVLSSPLYRELATTTLVIAVPTTVVSCTLGYVLAYAMTFGRRRYRTVLFAFVLSALMASYLARIYAWRTLLGDEGFVNTLLRSVHVIHDPIGVLLFTKVSIVLAEVNYLAPIAALTFFAALGGLDPDLRAASRDLGAGAVQTMYRVTLPLTGSAVLATACVVLFLSCGDYITPTLVGGSTVTFGLTISNAFGALGNYGLGGSLSFLMLAGFAVVYLLVRQAMRLTRLLPARGSD